MGAAPTGSVQPVGGTANGRRRIDGGVAQSVVGIAGASDRALVEMARAGPPRDREGRAGLYERYAPVVHGVLIARVQPADADDLTQEVFITAMRRLGELREAERVGGWLASIARQKAAGLARAGRRWRVFTARVALERGRGGKEGEGEERRHRLEADATAGVLAALRSMPEAYAETLAMRLVSGLTGPQIAERLGMTHGSVRVNLTRGMKMLREKLGEAAGKEDVT